MAQTREVVCQFYEFEGCCAKGHEGTFRDACQFCKKYKPKKGAAPARKNEKRRRVDKIREHDMMEMLKDY